MLGKLIHAVAKLALHKFSVILTLAGLIPLSIASAMFLHQSAELDAEPATNLYTFAGKSKRLILNDTQTIIDEQGVRITKWQSGAYS